MIWFCTSLFSHSKAHKPTYQEATIFIILIVVMFNDLIENLKMLVKNDFELWFLISVIFILGFNLSMFVFLNVYWCLLMIHNAWMTSIIGYVRGKRTKLQMHIKTIIQIWLFKLRIQGCCCFSLQTRKCQIELIVYHFF